MEEVSRFTSARRILGELTISDLVRRTQKYSRLGFGVLVALTIAGALSAMIQGGIAYLSSYLLIVTGLLPPIAIWIFSLKRNIPLVPSLALVNLVWNALPLAFGNPALKIYTDAEIVRAAGEILIFGVALTGTYLVVSSSPSPKPIEYLGFSVAETRSRKLVVGASIAGLTLAVVISLLSVTGVLFDLIAGLPNGTFSAIRVVQESVKMATSFALAYAIGQNYLNGLKKTFVIVCWVLLFIMALASLLLSSAAGVSIAIAAGLYLGSGRLPWKYVIVTVLLVAFFNYSKHEMRKKYWGNQIGSVQIHELPAYFQEWSLLTVEKFFGDEITKRRDKTQGLLERVSTLQMLLYVQRMVQSHNYSTLQGATYAMIPKLMIPRILWPGKPRTHEGQSLLNVHFGRQTEAETWKTYIAWGLIAEAYGNFGTLLGPIILGLFLGGFLTLVEVWSGNYPLMSIRGALATALLLETLISYEMSAAVLATSTMQLVTVISGAAIPLAGRHRMTRYA